MTKQAQTPGADAAAQTSTAADSAPDKGKKVKTPGAPAVTHALPVAADPDAHLPFAHEVDPLKIKGPQLTKQGWVCPDESGQKQQGR